MLTDYRFPHEAGWYVALEVPGLHDAKKLILNTSSLALSYQTPPQRRPQVYTALFEPGKSTTDIL